ncbi:MAG: phosphate uptake regulator PhoU [Nitrososphaerota archaeon]
MRPVYRRTLTSIGRRSYAVVLPKEWVNKVGLNPGDSILIEVQHDNSLLLRPIASEHRATQQAVKVIRAGATLRREITAAYLAGYDRIVLRSDAPLSSADREVVRRTVRGLTGAEVVSESNNEIEIQILLDTSAVEPEKVASRQNALVANNIEIVADAIDEWSGDRARVAMMMDEEIDRHYFTLVRAVRAYARSGRLPTVRLLDLRLVAKFLEDIGDRLVRISELIASNGTSKPPGEALSSVAEKARALVPTQNRAFESFMRYEVELAEEVISEISVLIDSLSSLERMEGVQVDKRAQAIVNELKRIAENQIDIADITTPLPEP